MALSGPTDITNREYYEMPDFGMNLYELLSYLSGHTYNEETYEDMNKEISYFSIIENNEGKEDDAMECAAWGADRYTVSYSGANAFVECGYIF